MTVFSEEGQTCGNISHSLKVNGCSSAQVYDLIEEWRAREDMMINSAINPQDTAL